MKTYLVSWDVCFAIVNCAYGNLFEELKNEDCYFIKEDGKIKYNWGEFKEDVHIEDVTDRKGVFFSGSVG